MKHIDCTTLGLPFLCRELVYAPSNMAQCICCIEDGIIIAGAIYDAFNGVSITVHVWIRQGKMPSRQWYGAIFDYPFSRLGVKKLIGQVAGNNLEAQKLDRHMGFVEEARIAEYSDDGDLIIYSMTQGQCRVLTAPAWSKVTSAIRGMA